MLVLIIRLFLFFSLVAQMFALRADGGDRQYHDAVRAPMGDGTGR